MPIIDALPLQPIELLNQAWTKPKLQHKAPNLLARIHRFNDVSSWVASTILNVRTRLFPDLYRMDLASYDCCRPPG